MLFIIAFVTLIYRLYYYLRACNEKDVRFFVNALMLKLKLGQ